MGSILASAAFALFFHWIGWRGLFILGSMPALLVFYVQVQVAESPVWLDGRKKRLARAAGAIGRARPCPANCWRFCLHFSFWSC